MLPTWWSSSPSKLEYYHLEDDINTTSLSTIEEADESDYTLHCLHKAIPWLTICLRGHIISIGFIILVALSIICARQGPFEQLTATLHDPAIHNLASYTSLDSPSSEVCRNFLSHLDVGPLNYRSAADAKDKPIAGKIDLFQEAGDQCITYQDRFSRYLDDRLGMSYRKNRKEVLSTDKGVEFAPFLGPIRPKEISSENWHTWLQERMKIINAEANATDQIFDWRALSDGCDLSRPKVILGKRTAILVRMYKGYVLTEDGILNLRALITELSISQPDAGYDIRIVVNVPDGSGVYSSRRAQERILAPMLPREFWGLVEFWSREEVRQVLPCGSDDPESYGPMLDCHGSDQVFAARHPEYDFIYHWEADVRFFGDYRIFISASEEYARNEATHTDLKRYQYHPIPNSPTSAHLMQESSQSTPSRGQEADLITFNPIFDPVVSGWTHRTRYRNIGDNSPRRGSVIAFGRMSARMYQAWNNAAVEHRKQIHCESWPSTLVLHSHLPSSHDMIFEGDEGKLKVPLKGVYVPHPLFFQKDINTTTLEKGLLQHDLYSMRKEGFLFASTYHPIAGYARDSYLEWRRGAEKNYCVRPHLVHPAKKIGYE